MEVELQFVRLDCPLCGIIQFYPTNFVEIKKSTYDKFTCANGHILGYQKPKPESPEALKAKIVQLETDKQNLKVQNTQLYHKLEQAGVE
jgi:hypothetical protein